MCDGTPHARLPMYGKGGYVSRWVLVDWADFYDVLRWKWHLSSNGYPIRMEPNDGPDREVVFMHRYLVGLRRGDGGVVDHINGDKLDNRRENLRVVDYSANAQNRRSSGRGHGLRGVAYDRRRGHWLAYGTLNYRRTYIGRFPDAESAARAAAEWRARHHPFATT